MGECLISRRGGEVYKLPTLNPSYPADITKVAAINSTATFSISITEDGKPAQYSYQWYVNGTAVAGAINPSYTMNTTATETGSHIIYCKVTNKAGVISSRAATLVVKSPIPVMSGSNATMTYSPASSCQLVSEDSYNWHLLIKGSGNLTFYTNSAVDVFVVGGGGGGGAGDRSGGGGGGKTTNSYNITPNVNQSYTVTIGSGGGSRSKGGTSSALGVSASGGNAGGAGTASAGGSGGSGGGGGKDSFSGYDYPTAYAGDGGTNGGNGGNALPGGSGGAGQGSTTKAFGSGTTYAGGGGGGAKYSPGSGGAGGGAAGGADGANGKSASSNTGGGGGGAGKDATVGGTGGSGIVIIRNHR